MGSVTHLFTICLRSRQKKEEIFKSKLTRYLVSLSIDKSVPTIEQKFYLKVLAFLVLPTLCNKMYQTTDKLTHKWYMHIFIRVMRLCLGGIAHGIRNKEERIIYGGAQ